MRKHRRVHQGSEKKNTKSCAEGNTHAISWWLHNKPPTTIYPPDSSRVAIRDRFSCLQDSTYSNMRVPRQGLKAFDSNGCPQSPSEVSVSRSLLQKYSVDLQMLFFFSICQDFKHQFVLQHTCCQPYPVERGFWCSHSGGPELGQPSPLAGTEQRFTPGQQECLQHLKAFKHFSTNQLYTTHQKPNHESTKCREIKEKTQRS